MESISPTGARFSGRRLKGTERGPLGMEQESRSRPLFEAAGSD